MKLAFKTIFVVLLALALTVPAALAQKSAEKAKYDQSTEVKLRGVIEEVKDAGGSGDESIVLKSGGRSIQVYVAPSSFLKDLECAFAKGDEIEVIGSKVNLEEVETVLVREITRGQLTLTLRDKKGVPVWTGWKRS